MAQTPLAVTLVPSGAADAAVTGNGQAADITNGNSIPASGNIVVVAYNSGTAAATVTINSVADEEGRTGNIVESIAAGAWAVFPLFPPEGWAQGDDLITLMASAATVLLLALQVQ